MIDHAANPLYLAAQISPDASVFFFTLSVFLIYVELNRPGSLLPGFLGLLGVLFTIASLYRLSLSPLAILLIALCAGLFLLDLLHPQYFAVPVIAILALSTGFCLLVVGPIPMHVHPAAGIACGLTLGTGTSLLTRIARRARANKAVD
jgi:membrane-bound ClpP family serine protease